MMKYSLKTLAALVILNVSFLMQAQAADFDGSTFLNNGPYQQGTVKIDRQQLQTVVTWCSPTLLQMRVYPGVMKSYPTLYQKLKGENHPLQVSVTVFPPSLPFVFAKKYSKPSYVTSVCNPASIDTSLASPTAHASQLKYNLGQSFKVSGKKLAVSSVNCTQRKAGYTEGHFKGPAYGKVGGVALIPAGVAATVTAQCQANGFSIQIK